MNVEPTSVHANVLLQIGLIEAGLLLPQGDVNLGNLAVARSHTFDTFWFHVSDL